VRVVEADAGATGLPRAAFDLVHARLVLDTLPAPERARVLAELVALTRPGGWVAVQDLDQVTHLCEPPHPAWDALLGAFLALQRANGQDPHLGRRLFGLLREAGLADVGVAVQTQVGRAGDFVPTQLPTVIRSLRDRVVARGLLGEAEFAAHLEALERHLADPGTIVVRSLVFQARGRKPA
jgi:hypothetical protein